jgi:aminomethyltransferase
MPLNELALNAVHKRLGARFAPFAGWSMPVQYAGIVEEHMAVRERAGVFDVSHMGRLYVSGDGAAAALRRAVTYKVDQLDVGEAHYALMCDEHGAILDDIFVYRIEDQRFLVINNAANVDEGRQQVANAAQPGVSLDDQQGETVILAVQGPNARDLVARVTGLDALLELRPRRCAEFDYQGATLFAARTGYTGEDGFELVVSNTIAESLLPALVEAGVTPCGLGARDTLRLEAALPLYGNDIDTTTTPWEAGLGFAVSLDDGTDFPGRTALVASKTQPLDRTLACIKATERGIMRAHCDVLHGGKALASMTSGGYSPLLGSSIGMAYLPAELAEPGTELQVDVRGKLLNATVVPRPFYRRKKSK